MGPSLRVHSSVSAVQAGDILAACASAEPAPIHSLLRGLAASEEIQSPSDSLEEERREVVRAIAIEVLSRDEHATRRNLEQAELLRTILKRIADSSQENRIRGEVPFYLQ